MLPALNPGAIAGHSAPDWGVVAVFVVVYLGMFLGGLPRLKLDRSGVALLGAIAVIALNGTPVGEAARAVDLPTIVLLFSFMVISAQMRLGGFYTAVTRRVAALPLSRSGLLAALLVAAGAMSAVFSNDIVWLAGGGVHLGDPGALLVVGAALSNLVSNVPAVMFLLPYLDSERAAVLLALVSTFAGNLLLVGSIANLIVVDLARNAGIDIDWKRHARTGIPVTLATVAILWLWL